jgi:Uma2 family endonuclease
MTITTTSLTLAEYLAYGDGPDSRYELVDGLLVAVARGTGLHGEIMHFAQTCLTTEIERTGQSLEPITSKLFPELHLSAEQLLTC